MISLLFCLVLLASLAFVDAGKKKQKGHSYPVPQKVIILQAGPSATYPWVGHCPPKGKCKHFYKVARPPFPSFQPPAPRLPYYAPAQYAPPQYAPAPYSAPVYAPPAPAYSQQHEPVYPQQYEPAYPQQPEPAYPQQPEPVYHQQPEPVYNQQSEPVYPQESELVYPQQSGPVPVQHQEPVPVQHQEPVYSQPAPVYAEQSEPIHSEPAPVYSQSAPVDSVRPPVEYSAPESFSENVIPAYSQSERVPDLPEANFAIQEVSAPEFNYGSGSSDFGSSESQSYVESTSVPVYSGPESYPVAEIESVPVEEPTYVPTEPTGYSGPSSSEIQQEIVQYAEEPELENVQQVDNYQQQDPETEFFNDPIFQQDSYENFASAQPAQPEYQEDLSFQPTDESDNYGERIRPREGRR